MKTSKMYIVCKTSINGQPIDIGHSMLSVGHSVGIAFNAWSGEAQQYYENLLLIKIIGISYSILGIIMSILLIGKDTYFSAYTTLIIAIITLLFLLLFYKRTPDGLKKYQELKILKNNIDNSNEEDIIKSISLGCFDNASKFYQDIVYQFDDVIKSAYLSKKQKHEEFIKI